MIFIDIFFVFLQTVLAVFESVRVEKVDVDSGSVRIGAECSQLIEQLRIIADNPGQVAVADDGI